MVGGADLLDLAKYLDPVTTVVVGAAILVYIRRVVQARLADVEDTQDDRENRLDDHELDSQEQALLIDDNAERVDQVEDAVQRLKTRVRRLEQNFAAEHNRPPRSMRGDGSTPAADTDRPPDGDPDADANDEADPGADGDDRDGVHPGANAATHRLRDRLSRIVSGAPSKNPHPRRTRRRRQRPEHSGDD